MVGTSPPQAVTVGSSPLVAVQSQGSQTPIFCPHAGMGEISFYYDLAERLGPDQPVYAFRPRGMYDAAPANRTMEEMAADYIREMRRVQPQGPYRLLGWCLGAVIAFEMARQLSEDGEPISELIALAGGPDLTITPVVGPPEPHWTTRHARIFQREGLRAGVRAIGRKIGTRAAIHGWGAAYRVGGLLLRLRLPIPSPLRPVYSMLNHARIFDDYRPRAYRGRMRLYVPAGLYVDPWLGWKSLVSEISVEQVPYVAADVREPFWPIVAGYFQDRKTTSTLLAEAPGSRVASEAERELHMAAAKTGEPIAASRPAGPAPDLESAGPRDGSGRAPSRPDRVGRPGPRRPRGLSQP